jgi:processive 1,2-diacylglycerol beta-glucosyltransferase
MQRHLIRRGQPKERTRITGIPIDPVFAERRDPAEARERLGMRPDLPAVLMLSGGYGVGSVSKLMQAFQGIDGKFQLVAVAGADERMRRKALAAATGLRVPTQVYGGVNNIHEMMDAADLVITKSGGLTSSEALAKRKPMIITDPIPGQEQRNCEYLLESGAAVRLYETDDAPFRVQSLLEDPVQMDALRNAAGRIGRPHAARDIALDILRRIGWTE